MADQKYSVTLTGRVEGDRDAPAVWQRVATLLKLDAGTFRERVLARVPVTLKAVDHEAASRQREALVSAGAEALMLVEDASPRVWVRHMQRTCGPLSMAYVRHALAGALMPGTTSACLQGSKQWQDLKTLADAHPAPVAASPQPASRAARSRAASKVPRRPGRPRRPSGRSSAAIVIVASLVLVAALAVLVAWPVYRSARARAAIERRIEAAAPMRAAVAGYFKAHGRFPVDDAQAGLPSSSAMQIDHGAIDMPFDDRAPYGLRGVHVRLVPSWSEGKVTWRCRNVDLPREALPAACR